MRASSGTLRLRVLGALRVDQRQTGRAICRIIGVPPAAKTGSDLVGTVLRRLESEGLVEGFRAEVSSGAVRWLLTPAGMEYRRELVAALTAWRTSSNRSRTTASEVGVPAEVGRVDYAPAEPAPTSHSTERREPRQPTPRRSAAGVAPLNHARRS